MVNATRSKTLWRSEYPSQFELELAELLESRMDIGLQVDMKNREGGRA